MLDEGLYSLDYRLAGVESGTGPCGEALVALRKGRILGSDRWGAVIDGSCAWDPVMGASRVCARLQLPPDGELVTGLETGPTGAVMEIDCAFQRARPVTTASVDLAGRRVELKLSYIGPLPI